MRQAAIILIMLGTFITGNPSVHAGSGNPFGFETNKHPLEYEYCKKEPGLYRGHGYTCSSAPRPHPDLEEYALQFVEGIGLCFIAGAHRDPVFAPRLADFLPSTFYSDSKRPLLLGNGFELLYRQIVKKYGAPTSLKRKNNPLFRDLGVSDFLTPETYHWYSEEGFKRLGDVKAIELHNRFLNEVRPRLADSKVQFLLVTSDACQAKIDEKANRAF